MSSASAVRIAAAKSAPINSPALLLQRKCACGGSAGFTGECTDCKKKKFVGKTLQTKLRIGEPGDQYEQEADRVADQVMRMTDAKASAKNTSPRGGPLVQRTSVQSNAGSGAAPSIVQDVLAASGQRLDADTRAFFESRFGHDFSNVRIHSDAEAQQSANEVNASAYTVGNDIVFGAGRYQPRTHEGRRLIAHELTHVIQQHAGSTSGKLMQRAQIPYGQISWADFKASPPNTKNPREGAGILTAFDVPSYSPATSATSTKRKCNGWQDSRHGS